MVFILQPLPSGHTPWLAAQCPVIRSLGPDVKAGGLVHHWWGTNEVNNKTPDGAMRCPTPTPNTRWRDEMPHSNPRQLWCVCVRVIDEMPHSYPRQLWCVCVCACVPMERWDAPLQPQRDEMPHSNPRQRDEMPHSYPRQLWWFHQVKGHTYKVGSRHRKCVEVSKHKTFTDSVLVSLPKAQAI